MGKRTSDLSIGDVFGSWTIIEEIPKPREKSYMCECICGNRRIVTKSNLRLGKSRSCNLGKCRAVATTHNMTYSRIYSIYHGIKYRLKSNSDRNKCYQDITMCDEWDNSFDAFSKWAFDNGYNESLTIDRIDTTKGYEPSNCRWVDNVVQSQNRRKRSSKDLPKGIYKSKPRCGKVKYKATNKAPYYWIVIYNGKRQQRWGFETVEEAYQDRCKFIAEHYAGLVYAD